MRNESHVDVWPGLGAAGDRGTSRSGRRSRSAGTPVGAPGEPAPLRRAAPPRRGAHQGGAGHHGPGHRLGPLPRSRRRPALHRLRRVRPLPPELVRLLGRNQDGHRFLHPLRLLGRGLPERPPMPLLPHHRLRSRPRQRRLRRGGPADGRRRLRGLPRGRQPDGRAQEPRLHHPVSRRRAVRPLPRGTLRSQALLPRVRRVEGLPPRPLAGERQAVARCLAGLPGVPLGRGDRPFSAGRSHGRRGLVGGDLPGLPRRHDPHPARPGRQQPAPDGQGRTLPVVPLRPHPVAGRPAPLPAGRTLSAASAGRISPARATRPGR